MKITISTHNGSAVARKHNIRDKSVVEKEDHIRKDGKFEIWKDEKPQDAYKRLFGKFVDEYNSRQTRSDRLIVDYYRQICSDKKKHPVYEMIVTVGNKEDYEQGRLNEVVARSILKEFVDTWHSRNPQLEAIGVYYHADEEGAPHLHIDYIPIANGFSRGMSTQTGLVKALEQQGLTKKGKATAQIQWEHNENKVLEDICVSRGYEVVHPMAGKGQKHLDTKVYKAKAAAAQAEAAKQKALDDITVLREAVLDEIKPKRTMFSKKQEITEETMEYIKAVDSRLTDVITRTQATEAALASAKEQEERAREHEKRAQERIARLDSEVKRRSDRQISAQMAALQKAKTAYETATQQIERRFRAAVADETAERLKGIDNGVARRLADYCNRITYPDGSTVWEHFIKQAKSGNERMLMLDVYKIQSEIKRTTAPIEQGFDYTKNCYDDDEQPQIKNKDRGFGE